MKRMLAVLLLLSIVCTPTESHSQTKVVYGSYKYVMGDNDTKNDAKRICLMEAKRRCLEQAGTYIETEVKGTSTQLTKNEIRTYAAAIIQSEVVTEEINFEGDTIAIYTTVKAEVETGDVIRKLSQIKTDTSLQKKIEEQNRRILDLEHKIRTHQQQLAKTDYDKSFQLRKERSEVFATLDVENEKIRKIIFAKRKRDVDRTEKIESKATKVRRILKNVELGMELREVKDIIKEITGEHFDMRFSKSAGGAFFYNCDKMVFVFRFDEYTDLRLLIEIWYEDKPPMLRLVQCTVILKRKDYNILTLRPENLRKETGGRGLLATMARLAKPLGQIEVCPKVCIYVWGKECSFKDGQPVLPARNF